MERYRSRTNASSVHQKLEHKRSTVSRSQWCVFDAILGSRKLTDEILNTTMCLVEGSLNARPLTPVSDDSGSLEALKPNHFL